MPIAMVPVDVPWLALRLRIQFCRGMGHGGVLNFGDAYSYALARTHQAPLLFAGDDFGTTNVAVTPLTPALPDPSALFVGPAHPARSRRAARPDRMAMPTRSARFGRRTVPPAAESAIRLAPNNGIRPIFESNRLSE
jgi:hypothetical protein